MGVGQSHQVFEWKDIRIENNSKTEKATKQNEKARNYIEFQTLRKNEKANSKMKHVCSTLKGHLACLRQHHNLLLSKLTSRLLPKR